VTTPATTGERRATDRVAAARQYVELGKRLPRRDATTQVRPAHPPFKRYLGAPGILLTASAVGPILERTYAASRVQHAAGTSDGRGASGRWTVDRPVRSGVLRPVPSGGAYYPAELYVIDPHGDAVAPGVHHFDAIHHSLSPVSHGGSDVDTLAAARARGPVIAVTCRLWKNRGTYGDFGYRLGALDVGCVVGQLLVAADGRAGAVHFVFPDDRLDGMLSVDSEVEATYALVAIELGGYKERPSGNGPRGTQARSRSGSPAATGLRSELAALHRVTPLLRQLHTDARRAGGTPGDVPPLRAPRTSDQPTALPGVTPVALADGIARRRSAYALARQPLDRIELSTLLVSAAGPGDGVRHVDVYLVANSVTDLARGAYRFDPGGPALVPLLHADLRARLRQLAPAIPPVSPSMSGGAVSIFLVGRYEPGIAIMGGRWYRIQNMLAGVLVQRFYLAAACLGLGCRASLGFGVDDVDRLLRLPSGHTSLVQLVIGRPEPECGVYDRPLPSTSDRGYDGV
jgi:SagB-type dehydrogenase family enzyme